MSKNSILPRLSLRRKGRSCIAKKRTAAAVVEFAVTVPVLVVLVFGTIEIANGIFLKQAICVAAYEGARAAVRPDGTRTSSRDRVREVLAARGIDNETVTFNPNPGNKPRGTKITVTVSVPSSELGAISPLQYLQSKTFTKSVAMVRM